MRRTTILRSVFPLSSRQGTISSEIFAYPLPSSEEEPVEDFAHFFAEDRKCPTLTLTTDRADSAQLTRVIRSDSNPQLNKVDDPYRIHHTDDGFGELLAYLPAGSYTMERQNTPRPAAGSNVTMDGYMLRCTMFN